MKRLFRGPFVNWFTNLLRNSKYRWFVILGSLIYLVSPIDIAPDVFPIIGWIDDGLLATLVVTELSQYAMEKRRSRKGQINEYAEQADAYRTVDMNNVIDVESITVG